MRIKSFAEKKCFITGAASGIGKATAMALADMGARLFLTDINQSQLEAVVSKIETRGGTVVAWEAFDISDHDAVRAFSERIRNDSGSMDIVMNIAGTSIWGSVSHLKHEHWNKMISINLMGPINVIECLLPAMVEAGNGGHLVNVSSAAGIIALPWHAAYSASKFGLRGVSEVLRYDLRRYGIGVSVVCPGAVKTPLVGTVQILGIDRDHKAAKNLVGRFEKHAVAPEKVARLILRAIQKNRFMVFTSMDIRLIYWIKRKFFPAYHLAMITMNNLLMHFFGKARQAD